MEYRYLPVTADDFDAIIQLGNRVHGDNYLDLSEMHRILARSQRRGINASWLVYQGDTLVGFRLTYAPGKWQPDPWCSPQIWRVPEEKVCYFKCNTVAESHRGRGIGSELLRHSIAAVQQQGAEAGVCHIWMQSPGNSAFRYFSRNGGEMIKRHPDRWRGCFEESGYVCVRCGTDCRCDAGEMLLRFPPAINTAETTGCCSGASSPRLHAGATEKVQSIT